MVDRRRFIGQAGLAVIAAASGSVGQRALAQGTRAQAGPMKTYRIPHTDLTVSRLAYGCSQLVAWNRNPVSPEDMARAEPLVRTAIDQGINLFDHADVYAFGRAESAFGAVLKNSPGLRRKVVVLTKTGQMSPRPNQRVTGMHVDVSRQHITTAAEGSLTRLGTDYLDILLLHAPDTLMEPAEIAAAFDALHRSGKVRYFGVSNFNAPQIELLRKAVKQPIVVNQIHLGLGYPHALSDGVEFPIGIDTVPRTGADDRFMALSGVGTLDYCRLNEIQIQAYSPLRGDLLAPKPDSPAPIRAVAQRLTEMAQAKGSTPDAIALAWLLHHPAHILPLIGSTNPEHIKENCAADKVQLTNEEWYDLLTIAAPLSERTVRST